MMATFCKKVDLKKQINFQCEKLIVDWSAAISDQILVLLLFCFTIGVRWNLVTSRLLLVFFFFGMHGGFSTAKI